MARRGQGCCKKASFANKPQPPEVLSAQRRVFQGLCNNPKKSLFALKNRFLQQMMIMMPGQQQLGGPEDQLKMPRILAVVVTRLNQVELGLHNGFKMSLIKKPGLE